jgi:hypothetical protein
VSAGPGRVPNLWLVAIPFLDALKTWHDEYVAGGGRRSVSVEWHEGPQERSKRAAWIVARGPSASGQLTLWESGECETEAVGTPADGEPHSILVRSRVLRDSKLVAVIADDLVDDLGDYSGT